MGYEIMRFIGEIDREFLCQICKLVLQNPVQIPCDHTFCYECLKSRITTDKTCPVDLIPITINGETSVFKPPCTAFRNLLYKLNIKCDFHSVGCSKIVKLENLTEHKNSCEYNSDAEVMCDKGCRLTVTRREYLMFNCASHLKREVMKLSHRVSFQRKRFEGLANCLYDRIKKQDDELSCHRTQKVQLENVIRCQQQEIGVLRGNRLSIVPLKWQICYNMHVDDTNNLKIEDYNTPSAFGFAQSYYPLQPARPFFQIKLFKASGDVSLPRNLMWIALTRRGHPIVRNPEKESIACIWNGRIQVNEEYVTIGSKWENEDIVKLGLRPNSFLTEGSDSAVVFLSKNEKLLFEKRVEIPHDGLFPTICIYSKDTQVTYIYN